MAVAFWPPGAGLLNSYKYKCVVASFIRVPMVNGAKHWCFTLNNYTELEFDSIILLLQDAGEVEYAIVGREVGDEGTPHLQGYIKLRRRRTLLFVKNRFASRGHFEVARGTVVQNRDYCSKAGDFREFGEFSETNSVRASRDELAVQFRTAFTGGSAGLDEFSRANPGTYFFYGHTLLRNTLSLSRPIVRPDIRVDWYWGAPGVGKSRRAHEDLPDAYIKEPRTKWWNGYLLEKEVIIDDFAPGGIDINHLLRWFDRYKCLVETKGGMVPLYASRFVVTSNFSPEECFRDKFTGEPHVQHQALMRRITPIELF